ncbi:MAG: hypothetical protein A2312_03415 [Candidatus Staskawiczbacteria bacterium RIFOXYB2_FULL_32_9]|uniref:Uncharacterized protein n=1 Tax=Candidatus Staskawiczbacteria bacterium RIFOXYD1_FULL_32_13 TaxID=1802234 RepID=A0A1G2JQA3_9BACT|nr:MAG: hypothetical protein UR22_C0036G0006 [Parcubacteria group bacterium GW2011_GWC2_32_10]OGZ78493.1 MAG: hypothetical protein A2360_05150 [Candidatus Staskawiczbacteria bacterium RIFOXYB1_FULL_32_11]OGZ82075.1 MAG: hypothetical protein A2312_03415 [Candidatus Staskawiczbacteria bacterium RIFOXYB2_FULL_32_9]OGZ88470.1 MAG: hypothetical protein A2561_03845 [Candidatus Staskawiczbacteria bacterium RIFOXYD1_FULL_32_13]
MTFNPDSSPSEESHKETASTPETILEKFNVKAGDSVKLLKLQSGEGSAIAQGSYLEGNLDYDIKNGKHISIDGGKKRTSSITGVGEKDGELYLRTETSIYKLVSQETVKEAHIITKKDLEHEIAIFDSKGYGQWDMTTGKVPLEDDPYNLTMEKGGFKEGDEVLFYAEKERSGILERNSKGSFTIRDKNGNPWGIHAILQEKNGYIKIRIKD